MLVSDITIRSVHVIEMSQFKTPYNEHYMFWAVPSKTVIYLAGHTAVAHYCTVGKTTVLICLTLQKMGIHISN